MQRLLRVTVGQLPVFDATLIVAAAEFDDHVYVMSGDVNTADITILNTLGVEWTYYGFLHRYPHFVSALVSGPAMPPGDSHRAQKEVTLSPL